MNKKKTKPPKKFVDAGVSF